MVDDEQEWLEPSSTINTLCPSPEKIMYSRVAYQLLQLKYLNLNLILI